jgi:membrane protease YdiL (CAAX protease family)
MNSETLNSNISNTERTRPLVSLFKTALWLLALVLAPQFILSFGLGLFYGVQQGQDFDPQAFNNWYKTVPVLLTITLLSSFLLIPLLIKATPAKTWPERFEFWCIKSIKRNELSKWLVIALGYWLITVIVGITLNLPDEQFMLDIKQATNSITILALVLTTICLIAPITEEIVFRGWLFSKIAQTKLGDLGAILLSSLAFTAIHSQYQHLETLVMLFTLGLLLSWVRYKSNNISNTIIMHMLFNLLAMASLFVF